MGLALDNGASDLLLRGALDYRKIPLIALEERAIVLAFGKEGEGIVCRLLTSDHDRKLDVPLSRAFICIHVLVAHTN